jgi:hypothetical protein
MRMMSLVNIVVGNVWYSSKPFKYLRDFDISKYLKKTRFRMFLQNYLFIYQLETQVQKQGDYYEWVGPFIANIRSFRNTTSWHLLTSSNYE